MPFIYFLIGLLSYCVYRIKYLLDMWYANIFSKSIDFFILLTSFANRVLIFDKIWLFPHVDYNFSVKTKNLLPGHKSKNFFCVCSSFESIVLQFDLFWAKFCLDVRLRLKFLWIGTPVYDHCSSTSWWKTLFHLVYIKMLLPFVRYHQLGIFLSICF